MNTYVFHWLDGHDETLTGTSAADALNRAGYGRGAVQALDYYEHDYEGNTRSCPPVLKLAVMGGKADE